MTKQHLPYYLALGMGIFCIGAIAGNYMCFRVGGWRGRIGRKYKAFIREHGGPIWPLYGNLTCLPLGIVIVFAAMVLSNRR